ncbi:hypothetical protein AB0K12_25610 [Nonomuraea sp. NPDC049419]|uniref:hypothetical protein n=1 Tax=Nonomuraea sp. NPDC049419 TaxID=3155772 RepID=UPI003429F8F6
MRLAWVLLMLLVVCAPQTPGVSWRLRHTWDGPGRHMWHSIAALRTGEVWTYVAGDTSLMMRWDGRAWRTEEPPDDFLPTGSGFGFETSPAGDDLWLASGGVWQRVRDSWVRRPNLSRFDPELTIKDTAVAAKGEAWLAEIGEYGGWVLNVWSGGAWREMPKPSDEMGSAWLEHIAAAGPGRVWAIHHVDGLIQAIRWEGSGWSTDPMPQVSIRDLAVSARGDAWAVGSEESGGVILRRQGERWKRVGDPLPGTALPFVRADVRGGVWIAADPGRGRPYVLHVKDGRWSKYPLPESPLKIMDLAPAATGVWVYARQGSGVSKVYELSLSA